MVSMWEWCQLLGSQCKGDSVNCMPEALAGAFQFDGRARGLLGEWKVSFRFQSKDDDEGTQSKHTTKEYSLVMDSINHIIQNDLDLEPEGEGKGLDVSLCNQTWQYPKKFRNLEAMVSGWKKELEKFFLEWPIEVSYDFHVVDVLSESSCCCNDMMHPKKRKYCDQHLSWHEKCRKHEEILRRIWTIHWHELEVCFVPSVTSSWLSCLFRSWALWKLSFRSEKSG